MKSAKVPRKRKRRRHRKGVNNKILTDPPHPDFWSAQLFMALTLSLSLTSYFYILLAPSAETDKEEPQETR